MRRLLTPFLILAVACSAVLLYRVHVAADAAEARFARLERMIAEERERRRMLEAEYAHRTRPEALRAAAEALGFTPPDPAEGDVVRARDARLQETSDEDDADGGRP